MPQAPCIAYSQLASKAPNNLLNLPSGLCRDLLDARLIDLMLLRVLRINGRAFCIDVHRVDLIKMGEDPCHPDVVASWHGTPFFTERERGTALRWAGLATNTLYSGASDEEFVRLREYSSDEEIAELSSVIATTNSWNLLNVNLRNLVSLKALHAAAA